ncbi:MAG: Shikimate kinase [Acidimicrobiales bacterium]|nr:Shikimate kinase [Acidimicrobiales bacterium]
MATSKASGSSAEHIVLVGMMGAGKTSVGQLLARRLDRPFFDVDAWIEDEEGTSIASLFQSRGEAAFRDLEARVLPSFLASRVACVLAVGGGAVTEERNRTALNGEARVVWLRATDQTLVGRVGDGSDRPLLAGKDVPAELAGLSLRRTPMYTEVADVVVDVDGLTPDEIVDRITAALP